MSEFNLPKGYLSISQIETYMKCGLQYYYRYVQGKMTPPGIALVTGSSGHAALELNFTHKAETMDDLPVEDVLDKFSDSYDQKVVEVEGMGKVAKGAEKDRTAKLITIHQEIMAPSLMPMDQSSVEGEIRMPIGGVPMLGYFDLETDTALIDHKFVGKAKGTNEANDSLQLTFYSKAKNKPDVAFNCLIKSKPNKAGDKWSDPRVVMVTGRTRTEADYKWLESVVRFVAAAISRGVFVPAPPDHWACTKRFCGYYDQCRGSGKDVSPTIIGVADKIEATAAKKEKKADKPKAVFEMGL
jgi:hypothetical protein